MNKLRWIFVTCLVIALAAASGVISKSEAKYESTSIIMLKRAQMERSGHSTEESRNRWVWVRDGLELKNELVSESVLKKVLEIVAAKTPTKGLTTDAPHLRKQIEVHYSGGDDNLFTIRVQHADPALVQVIADAYLEVFPNLAIERRMLALESLSDSSLSAEQISRKVDIIETIKSDITLAKAERDQRIVVIQSATPAVRIWPKPIFILVAFACFGLFVAAFIAVILKNTHKNRH